MIPELPLIPPDTARTISQYLRPLAPSYAVGLSLPSTWRPGGPTALIISDDGGAGEWPVSMRTRIRVTAWSHDRNTSRDAAAWAMGVLLTHTIPGVAQIRDPSAILDAVDSRNSGSMAGFTVAVRARTITADLSIPPE